MRSKNEILVDAEKRIAHLEYFETWGMLKESQRVDLVLLKELVALVKNSVPIEAFGVGDDIKNYTIALIHKDGTYEINGIDVLDAVEKQRQKKPLTERLRADGYCGCPVCRHLVDSVSNYCEHCGQKLEWGEQEWKIN